jgi:hypothetical protein
MPRRNSCCPPSHSACSAMVRRSGIRPRSIAGRDRQRGTPREALRCTPHEVGVYSAVNCRGRGRRVGSGSSQLTNADEPPLLAAFGLEGSGAAARVPTIACRIAPDDDSAFTAMRERASLSEASVNYRQIAGYRRLGDPKTELQQLAVDPRRTPRKVVAGHLHNQCADFTGNPGTLAPPATTRAISS